nr:hypothetical protein [Tanacetum cinerariifolium]
MSTDKESSVAGTDNRPSMLVESDYESWKIRIERYIRGKPLGKLIWRSIQNGPTPLPQITETEGQGDAAVQVTRDKTDEEFTEIENNRELADIQATNILSQGLPRHVFNILNQTHEHQVCKQPSSLLVKVCENVKNNKDIFATTYVKLYTYFKSYEPHAMKTLKKQEQSSSIIDPLAYLASTTHHLTPIQPTNPPPFTTSLTLPPPPAAQSSNDVMLATMNQIVNLLSGFQKQLPPTNNQLRTSSNSRSHATVTDNKGKLVICYNCRGEGHVSRQCKEKKRVKDSQYFKDKMLLMEAKEKEAVLDAEVKAFLVDVECTAPYDQPLAITTTNIFEEEHLDFDVESDIDDNTIPYHQYQLDSEVQDVPTEVSSVSPGEISMITILDDLRNQLDGHLKVYWLPAEELATQKSNPPKPVTPFVNTRLAPKYEQCILEKKKLQIERKNLLIQNECLIIDCIAKDICSIVLASDRDRPLSEELSSNCVRENSKVIELEAEMLKQQQMLAESNKQCSFIQKNHIDLQIKFRNYKECLKNQTIGDNSHSPTVNAVFEINQLTKQHQEKDDTIMKLQTHINNMSMLNVEPTLGSFDKQALETELTQLKDAITSVRIQNDGFTVENVNLKRRYQELSTSNSQSRDTHTRKITALTGNAKLKSESLSKMHSEAILPKKPKVLTPG